MFLYQKQKKPATIFDEKPKEILAENKTILESQKIEENVGNGKSEKPKEAGKANKETTEEKQETVEEKLVKKDVPKKQKKVEKPKQKTIKIKIENVPAKKKAASVEPNLDDPTTEASIVQKPKVKEHSRVSKELILTVPKSHVKRIKPKNGASTKTDSLSRRHEVGMIGLVESPSQTDSQSLKLHGKGLCRYHVIEKLAFFTLPTHLVMNIKDCCRQLQSGVIIR
uniref:Uncharacterized protein n=1 Tax=Panagrolaimus superbus TaxID=310955 RepID=A0A914YCV6_9BILA